MQYFAYDALNRIDLANTQSSAVANAWGQAFGYDPWGNLTSVTVTQGSAPGLSVAVNSNNQFAGAHRQKNASLLTLFDHLRRKRNTAVCDDTGFVSQHDAEEALATACEYHGVIRSDIEDRKRRVRPPAARRGRP